MITRFPLTFDKLAFRYRVKRWPSKQVCCLESLHFEAQNSLPNAPKMMKNRRFQQKNVCLCIKCRSVLQKCRFFAGQIVVVLFVFIQIPASIVINFFFLFRGSPPRHFFPAAATTEPSRPRMICPVFSASVWAFVLSSRRPGAGAAFRPLPSY